MSYNCDDLGSSIQFSCSYRGHESERVFAVLNLFFLIITLSFVTASVSQNIFSPSFNFRDVDWWKIASFGIFILAILIYFGAESLWQFVGKEVFILSKDEIVLQHRIFGISLSRRFRARKVKGLFLTEDRGDRDTEILVRRLTNTRSYGLFYFRDGKIAFDFEKTWPLGRLNTYRFGADLTYDDVIQIVTMIYARFPQYQNPKIL